MKLEAEGQPAIVDPEPGQLTLAVSALALPDRPFLILSRSRTSFVQVAIVGPERFHIEHRDRGQPLMVGKRSDLTRDEVARVLEAYRQEDAAWDQHIEWQSSGANGRLDRVSMGLMLFAAALMIVAVIAWNGPNHDNIFGMTAFHLFSLAYEIYALSILIDMRKFRTLNARAKVRAIGSLVVGVLLALVWLGG